MQGKDGWLFLASELRLLGHGPFWGEHAESEEADPLHSITDLNSKLEELGIQLIFCPAPPRAVIYPDKILDDAAPGLRVDEDLQAFYAALREKGVTVVDVTETLIEARGEDDALGPVSCEQDSHWSPRGLRIVAEAVVQEFADDDWLADATKGSFTEQQPEPLLYVGDLVRQLEGHPATQSRTTISRMTDDPAGQTPLTFDDASPVLLLADSHGLVFSTGDDMHCTAAGFGEALSAEVGFAIDRMARRGSGDQVRRDLARRFIRKPEEAAQKKVLIYTFAARTLLTGTNWKPVPLKR